MILRPEEIPSRGVRERTDVCVVGSGAAGATAAKTLADSGLRVVLLEAGAALRPEEAGGWTRSDLLGLYAGGGARTNAAGDVRILQGAALGGSTTVGDAILQRPSAETLAEWLSEGGIGFTAEEVARALRKNEELLRAEPTAPPAINANDRLLAAGAEAMGAATAPLPRAASGGPTEDDAPGVCIAESRRSALTAFVPLLEAFGVKIFTGARAERVRSGAVEGRIGEGKPLAIDARAVVLAAGALETPRLLAAHGAGGNLHLSPTALVAGLFDRDIRAYEGAPSTIECRAWEAGLGVVLRGHGPHPAWLAPCLGDAWAEAMAALPRLGVFEVALRDRARGAVSADGGVAYALGAEDAAGLAEGAAKAAEVLFAAGARKVFTPYAEAPALASRGEVARLRGARTRAGQLLSTAPGGTCAPATGAVGPTLEVEGAPGVYVVDASILPSPAGAPPQAAIMALAECAAARLAAALHHRASG